MPTNLNIDDRLLAKAQKLGGFKTKRDTVNEALRLLIQRKNLKGIEKGFGTVDFREDFLEEMDRRMSRSTRLAALRTSSVQKNAQPKKGRR